MSKHTPGPWNVSECGSIEFADGFLGEAYDFNGTTKTDLPMMANARLMAAAPELLEALKELYNASLVMEQPRFYKALAEAKKVIAKIEGDE
jgi:hypothetical protein